MDGSVILLLRIQWLYLAVPEYGSAETNAKYMIVRGIECFMLDSYVVEIDSRTKKVISREQ
jgi:hypothetical protein